MRWLVVGSSGMLGQDLVTAVGSAGHDVRGVDRESIDITDWRSVEVVVRAGGYDVVARSLYVPAD